MRQDGRSSRRIPTEIARPARPARPARGARDPARWAGRARPSQAAAAGASVLLLLFLAALLVPVRFFVGDLLLGPSRLFLLVVFVPLFFRLVSGRAGPIQPVDRLILLFCLWIGVAIFAVHGPAQIPFIGITVVELFGGYLVGRTLVRSQMDYRAFFRYFAWGLLVLLPFVVFEQLTRRMLLSEMLGKAFDTYPYVDYVQRLGLNRVQSVFEHPILHGVFCSLAIGNFYYLNRGRLSRAAPLTGLAVFMTFMAVSSAALMSIVLQLGLIAWEKITRANWVLLAVLVALAYVAIDLLSNRSPVEVFVSYLTLNSGTAYNRILIWDYGIANLAQHPFFGLGLNDWERPDWMSGSVDNFWLLTAMRYGLPAAAFLVLGIAASLWRILARRGLSPEEAECRTAYMVAGTALFFTLATVHVWGSTAILFMFYIGAGVWLAQAGPAPEPAAPRGGGGTPDRR